MTFGDIPAGWFAIGIAALVTATLLLILATRLVLGSAAKLGNALITVMVSVAASWAIDYGVGYVLLDVVNKPELMLAATIVVGAIVTPVVYVLLLRGRDGKRPSILQAALIYIITVVLASLIFAGVLLLAVYVFHLPPPDLSWIE